MSIKSILHKVLKTLKLPFARLKTIKIILLKKIPLHKNYVNSYNYIKKYISNYYKM
jgi:hypothetical protein